MQERLRKSLQIIKSLQEQLAEKRSNERVSVLGSAFTLPGGNSGYRDFWQTLNDKKHTIAKYPLERVELLGLSTKETENILGGFIDSIDQFDPGFFNIGLEEAKAMDPQHRILLELVWRAFEDANINIDEYRGKRVGVFVAMSNNDYSFQRFRTEQAKSPYDFTGNILATAAGRISYTFDFRGPALVVDTACSSALVAMDQAFHSLNERKCDLAVVAGVNLILDLRVNEVLRQIEATSPEGFCKPLDASANGYTRSEGGAAFVLKRTSDIDKQWEKPICEIIGSATNHDGKSNGFTAPNGKAQEAVIKEALRNAGIKPADVDFIELHGTGTKLGDPIEIEAIRNVFTADRREKKLLLGAVKSNLGHLECAAGFAGLIKVMLSLQHKSLPPTVNISKLNPLIQWHEDLEVPLETKALDGREKITAGISSFGISGTNAHLIVAAVNETQESPEINQRLPLLISAPSEDKLNKLMEDFRVFLQSAGHQWSDICAAAAVGRKHWPYRAAIIAGSVSEAIEKLQSGHIAYSQAMKTGEHKEWSGSQEMQGQGIAPEILRDYLSGKEINWKEVFSAISQKTGIPGLPFSKRQCWVYKNHIADKSPIIGELLGHPFLKRLFKSPSDSRTHNFLGTIDLDEHKWLEGHRLFNQVVFPGAGVHELACFAGQSVVNEAIQVDNLRIIEPIFIEKQVSVWIELKQDDKKHTGVLYTQSVGQEWIKSSSFEISSGGRMPEGGRMPVEGQSMDISKFYERCKSIGINYQDRFAQLQEVTLKQRFLGGKIFGNTSTSGFLIAPDVLDNCFQVFGVWLMEQFGSKAFVPTDTKSFRFYQQPQGPVEISVKLPDQGLVNGKTTASFSIHSSNGLCAELVDFSVMQVDKDKLLKSFDRLDNHIYELSWEREEIGDPQSAATRMPEFKTAFDNRPMLERSAKTLVALDVLADELVAHIFHELGFPQKLGQQLPKATLCKELNISERHSRLFDRILEIGLDNNWLNESDQCYGVNSIPQPDITSSIRKFGTLYPHAALELKVLCDCARSIPQVLTGQKDPLEILFPSGSTEVLSGFYNCDPFLIMYDLCKNSFATWLEENGRGKKIKILEIGAGTGSTTKQLLPLLRGRHVDYEFTDISPLFLSVAQDEFKDYPFITYRLLNIEASISGQGFNPESYDLIIASNVLHATRNLADTFKNVSALLKDDGSLLMVEGNMSMKWIDLIFGLTSGWWLFSDSDLRPKHATLSVEKWRGFLTSSGFASPQFIEPFFEDKTASGQSVIWTQKKSKQPSQAAKINWLLSDSNGTTKGEKREYHDAPYAVKIGSKAENKSSEDHVGILLQLIEKLKFLQSENPAHKRLFIFYNTSANKQIIGFWRVLQNEWPDWDINLVIADDMSPALIQAEITSASKGDCSRWSRSGREVLRLRRKTLEDNRPLDFRHKKVLVTGASGGLAQALIAWLLDKGVNKVIGVSRTRLPEAIGDKRVEYHYSDLLDWANGADMDGIFAIFHLAGTLDNQLVVNHSSQSILNVLRPKIDGALRLRHLAASHSIPHLIHFGSSASWLGTVGQANHAYANFGLADTDKPGSLQETSILWGAWTSRGAVKKYDAESWVNRIGMGAIQTQEGLNLMDRIIGSGNRELGVFQLNWSKYREVMKNTPLIQGFIGANDEPTTAIRIENSPEAFASHDEVASWLEAELSYTLGYESSQSFDHDTGFFDLGLDSLTTLDLVKRIEKKVNTKLPSTILFKYPTIRQLAGFVLDQYAGFSHDAGSTGSQSEEDLAAMQFIDDQFNEMIDETR